MKTPTCSTVILIFSNLLKLQFANIMLVELMICGSFKLYLKTFEGFRKKMGKMNSYRLQIGSTNFIIIVKPPNKISSSLYFCGYQNEGLLVSGHQRSQYTYQYQDCTSTSTSLSVIVPVLRNLLLAPDIFLCFLKKLNTCRLSLTSQNDQQQHFLLLEARRFNLDPKKAVQTDLHDKLSRFLQLLSRRIRTTNYPAFCTC